MCRGCMRINIGEGFWGTRYFGRFAILLIFFVQQRVVPRNYYFSLYSN